MLQFVNPPKPPRLSRAKRYRQAKKLGERTLSIQVQYECLCRLLESLGFLDPDVSENPAAVSEALSHALPPLIALAIIMSRHDPDTQKQFLSVLENANAAE